MKLLIKIIIFQVAILSSTLINAQVNDAKIYWVGHSLISHYDSYDLNFETYNLIELMEYLATSQGKTYGYYKHTTPGAPLGWNWGANADAWASVGDLIQPLINTSHTDYGSYDVIVLTEGIDVRAKYDYWASSFYARKFYNAAKLANSSTRLFMYESWHHYQASDLGQGDYYGPQASFDWKAYMLSVRPVWESIIDQASDPSLTQSAPDYVYQGEGGDPGNGNDILNINIIPTGQVLISVFDRLNSNLESDDWTYNGSTLTPLDFFANPLTNFPDDLDTRVHPSDAIDDIHPSNVLIYLNSLVHYAVVYQEDPANLPALNKVPSNIADIFKEVVWDVVTHDARTGLDTQVLSIEDEKRVLNNSFSIYPNPAQSILNIESKGLVNYQLLNTTGKVIMVGNENRIDISLIPVGIYFLKVDGIVKKLIKK